MIFSRMKSFALRCFLPIIQGVFVCLDFYDFADVTPGGAKRMHWIGQMECERENPWNSLLSSDEMCFDP